MKKNLLLLGSYLTLISCFPEPDNINILKHINEENCCKLKIVKVTLQIRNILAIFNCNGKKMLQTSCNIHENYKMLIFLSFK